MNDLPIHQSANTPGEPAVCDVLVRNAYLMTMDSKRTVYASGALAVRGTDIIAVGRDVDLAKKYAPMRTIDAQGAVVHPGFVDCHYHVTLHLSRGSVSDDPEAIGSFGYAEWFNSVEDQDEYVQTQAMAVEMLRNGYTCVVEPGTVFEPDAAASALQSVGVRGTLADPFMWDEIDGGNALAQKISRAPCTKERTQKLLGRELRRNNDPNALVRGHIGIFGSGSQSEDLMRAANGYAKANDVIMTMHHNFSAEQTERDDRRFGGGGHSIVSFAEKDLIGPYSTFVHLNMVRDDEIDPVVKSGMSVIWQPANYLFYGVDAKTKSRMAELIKRGVRVAFGVDVAKVFTFGDLDLIGYLIARKDGGYISTAKVLEMRTCDAARAAGMDRWVGSLEPGKRADLVIRNNEVPESSPGVNPLQELLLGGQASTVRTVLVNGREVYSHGQPTLIDGAGVNAAGRKSVHRVLERAGYSPREVWPVVR